MINSGNSEVLKLFLALFSKYAKITLAGAEFKKKWDYTGSFRMINIPYKIHLVLVSDTLFYNLIDQTAWTRPLDQEH